LPGTGIVQAQDGDARRVRKLVLLTEPQAVLPKVFESVQLAGERLRQLGLDLEVKVMPTEPRDEIVWFNRDVWDMTAWRLVGRPERVDPDELVYNLFHSSTAADGFNFVGYENPEYEEIAEAQRVEMDRERRRELIHEAQQIIARDQPYIFFVYPHVNYAFNNAVWDAGSIVDFSGIGIKNFWTFVQAVPLGDQKDMILNTQSAAQAINPLFISDAAASWVTELIWDRLTRVDPEGVPQPWAAESVEWTDDTTVVCTLRPGMAWHDGQPFTVDDVVFSFNAPKNDMAPNYQPFVEVIEEVRPVGDNQVEFVLATPSAPFETSTLGKLNLIPKHVWEPILAELAANGENAERYQEETPIGSGPFKFASWNRGEQIVLDANKEHFAAPAMDRWILRDVANVSAALGALQSGELNLLSDYTGDADLLLQATEENPDLTMVSTIEIGFHYLAPNCRRAPMDDPAFRQAMAAAIGRDDIQSRIYEGYATTADSHVSKALEFWHAPDLPAYGPSDIEGAKAILAEAGYEWDEEGRLLYPEGQTESLQPET
jgi:peptide/nickel transport system substrate-binding protein